MLHELLGTGAGTITELEEQKIGKKTIKTIKFKIQLYALPVHIWCTMGSASIKTSDLDD